MFGLDQEHEVLSDVRPSLRITENLRLSGVCGLSVSDERIISQRPTRVLGGPRSTARFRTAMQHGCCERTRSCCQTHLSPTWHVWHRGTGFILSALCPLFLNTCNGNLLLPTDSQKVLRNYCPNIVKSVNK